MMNICGSESASILTVGQSPSHYRSLLNCLRGARWSLLQAPGVRSAQEIIGSGEADVVICDLALADGSWLDILNVARHPPVCTPVVVATETLDARLWADALCHGAYDVLAKPFNTEEVLYVVRNAWLMHKRNRKESDGSPPTRDAAEYAQAFPHRSSLS